MIYAVLKRVLYVSLIASLLFWQDLYSALQSWGFEPNPYESCVMNKTFYGKKCMIFWHVENIKILYVSLKVAEKCSPS